jgi:RNA polymerase sigma factor (TIGR02999 family)
VNSDAGQARPGITRLLGEWSRGEGDALERLTPQVYDELHRLAEGYMRRERAGHTFSATALVSEAFLRLTAGEQPSFNDRVHFLALAARNMRRILVDHARRRTANKRGKAKKPVTFDEGLVSDERPEELCALDDALEALEAVDSRKARVVLYHYFGGMSQKEIAAALEIHENTVARDLRMAQAWIGRHIREH